jgi:hypothetical protein
MQVLFMSPYIGDRQLDPDAEHECPYCFGIFGSTHALIRHVPTCPKNDVEPEEE